MNYWGWTRGVRPRRRTDPGRIRAAWVLPLAAFLAAGLCGAFCGWARGLGGPAWIGAGAWILGRGILRWGAGSTVPALAACLSLQAWGLLQRPVLGPVEWAGLAGGFAALSSLAGILGEALGGRLAQDGGRWIVPALILAQAIVFSSAGFSVGLASHGVLWMVGLIPLTRMDRSLSRMDLTESCLWLAWGFLAM